MDHNTNITLARVIVPILKDYAKNLYGIPGSFLESKGYSSGMVPESEHYLVSEAWDDVVNSMVEAFEAISKDAYTDSSGNELPEVRSGISSFSKYFNNLWS